MLTDDEIRRIVADCVVPGFTFLVRQDSSSDADGGNFQSRLYLQVQFVAFDTSDLEAPPKEWRGRKWYLSPYMIRDEVVRTAFAAYTTALEHEAREMFRYRGAAIFGPHISIDALVDISDRVISRETQ